MNLKTIISNIKQATFVHQLSALKLELKIFNTCKENILNILFQTNKTPCLNPISSSILSPPFGNRNLQISSSTIKLEIL